MQDKRSILSQCFIILLFFVLTSAQEIKSAETVLSVVIEVNDAVFIAKPGHAIRVAYGDVVKMKSIELDKGQVIESGLNLQIEGLHRRGNHLGLKFSTAKDLIKKNMVREGRADFKVKVLKGSKELADFTLEVKYPQLRYVVVEVNGEELVLHDQERIVLEAKDKIRVKRVATNIEENDDKADFKIQPLMGPHEVKGIDFYSMNISRAGESFASITMVVNR